MTRINREMVQIFFLPTSEAAAEVIEARAVLSQVRMEEEKQNTTTTLAGNNAEINYDHPTSSGGDSNPCPICLGSFVQESYLDTCFHKFCYKCIIRWSKVASDQGSLSDLPPTVKCPLCKAVNFSIIYAYDGSSFQRYYLNQSAEDSFFSEAHKYRLHCYYMEPGILDDVVNVARYWKSHKYLQSNRWLEKWLRREVQALLQEEDVEIIVHHIYGVVGSLLRRNDNARQMITPEAKREEFKSLVSDAARPFLAGRAGRFTNELEIFLASGWNMEAYDEVYMQRLGLNTARLIGKTKEQDCSDPTRTVPVPYMYIFDVDADETD